MVRKFVLLLLVALLSMMSVSGLAQEAKWGEGIVIGYSELQASGAFGIAQKADIYRYAQENGAKIVFADAEPRPCTRSRSAAEKTARSSN